MSMDLYTSLQSGGYLDSTYGVVSNAPNAFCDNFHLFTCEADQLNQSWPNYIDFYDACEIAPGLIARYPGKAANGISQDEMMGAATLYPIAAQRILAYGRAHHWYFNPSGSKFSLSNWFGRFLDFPPYIKFCAGSGMNIIDQLAWSIMTFFSPISPQSDTSGKLLKLIQVKALKGHYFICDLAIAWYYNRMSRAYPEGPQQLFSIYFGATHPMTVSAPTQWP